jgi:hypothetical protein
MKPEEMLESGRRLNLWRLGKRRAISVCHQTNRQIIASVIITGALICGINFVIVRLGLLLFQILLFISWIWYG